MGRDSAKKGEKREGSEGFYDGFDLFLEYVRELKKETPRGVVLISGVVLEELLGRTLENFLTDHKDVKALLNGVQAPLGSFYTRAVMAFGLRLIDDKEYRNLTMIRKVRNHFAHKIRASFEDPEVIAYCNHLDASGLRPDTVDTPEKKYRTVAAFTAALLRNRPNMSIGRVLGEAGWQDRVKQQINRALKQQRD